MLFIFVLLSALSVLAQENPDGFPEPDRVVLPGTFQDALGCGGEWNTSCEESALTYNEETGLWEGTFLIPAGVYEYKIALDGSWDRNYGLGGVASGPNIPLVLEADSEVSFSYDHSTGIVIDSVNGEELIAAARGGRGLPPTMVNIPGTLQPALGCPGEWAPDCDVTALSYVEAYDIWEGSFELPAGDYKYKVALNGGWDTNYGAFADPGGPDIALNIPEDTSITFIYDNKSHWILDDVRQQIITAVGSYQDEIGCAEDWQADCMLSWLQDVDGDGVYTLTGRDIPAGDYEMKMAIGRSMDESYGVNGENIAFTVETDGDLVILSYDANTNIPSIVVGGTSVTLAQLRERRAHWVTSDTLIWDVEFDESLNYQLLYSADSEIGVSVTGITGNYESFDLSFNEADLSSDIADKFPHLVGQTAFQLSDEAQARVAELLRGQILLAVFKDETLLDMTGVQIPGVLDELYSYEGDLGLSFADGIPTFTLWTPTAQNVSLNLYADTSPSTEATVYEMVRDDKNGTWSVTGEADWYLQYYTFNVTVYAPGELEVVENEVTDPYSIGLSQNSTRSLIIDLNDSQFMPDNWETLAKPDFGDAPEDITIYELHIRDFSIFDESVPEDYRGTYLAFTVSDSYGMQHLSTLAEAGMTHLHLLPTFDIATINENRRRQFAPDYEDFAGLPADSEEQQAAIYELRELDGFNWGYDPYHYMTPEGSYATNANGGTRILEYRQMVMAINNTGLRVVQDVVFNHTNASGQSPRSVLDRIVPGYYHRLDASGAVSHSTCCENTATEHNMMRRLMVDTLVLNAVQYKIDGFRFDLMGHHMVDDMLAVREALDSLTLEKDGVDGSSIYLYGEGWNFGEVQDNARGINATQFNLAGTGIGTFNDRLRDAVRGGSPFGGRDEQGVGNGLYVLPNGMNAINEDLDRALLFADRTRVGLAGNLQTYTFIGSNGAEVTGYDVDYNGSPAGYTLDPQENIVYVSKHDNETLYDNILFRLPPDLTASDVVRMQNLSLSYVMYSQGVPFFQAGSDMLRSKSLDRDSYDSGDWFNAINWTYATTNFGMGLPVADKNAERWERMSEILTNPDYVPTQDDILLNVNVFREMLQIRYSSPLFHLGTADDVQARLTFHNVGAEQIPGVIIMSLSDTAENELDANYDRLLVIFNARPDALDFAMAELAGTAFELHPILQNSYDEIAQTASFDSETARFSVPAWTTSVFVLAK
jgi:pullulanase-type alpha-1,6-glucosidase